jgi:hypothetical protein
MGNYENLKQSITEVIRTNGNQEITGAVLQSTLLTIISTVGANATFAGIATPTTNPGIPDGPVFYLASEGGTYTNFNAIELQDGLSVLMWNGSWNSQQILSIDNEPTAGSDNLVKSGGVVNYIGITNIQLTGANATAVSQKFNTIIGHRYRIYLPETWDVSGIPSGSVWAAAFLLRYYPGPTDVTNSEIKVVYINNRPKYYDFTSEYEVYDIYARATSEFELNFKIYDLDSVIVKDFLDINDEISDINQDIEKTKNNLGKDNVVAISAVNWNKTSGFTSQQVTNRTFIGKQPFHTNVKAVGLVIKATSPGTVTLIKCTSNFKSASPSFEEQGTYNVVTGVNYIYFTSPIFVNSNQAIGFTSTANIVFFPSANISYSTGFYEWQSNYANWNQSNSEYLVSILVNDMSQLFEDVYKNGQIINSFASRITHSIISNAHAGFNPTSGYNNNKLEGYENAAKYGFNMAECDVRKTSDNILVAAHDDTFTDGGETITISTSTYDELMEHTFYGGKIAKVEDILSVCKRNGLALQLDNIPADTTSVIYTLLFDLLHKYRMWNRVNFVCSNMETARFILNTYNRATVSIESNWALGAENCNTLCEEYKDAQVIGAIQYSLVGSVQAVINTSKLLNPRVLLNAWTIDDVDVYRQLMPHVDIITSNTKSEFMLIEN